MKKVYQSSKQKRHSRRRSQRALRRKQHKKWGKRFYREKKYTTPTKKDVKRAKDKKTIVAPHNLSILNNTEKTLEFFNGIRTMAKSYNNIYLDMSQIERLTSDAILYILSLLDYMNKKYKYIKFGGNYPDHDDCKELFVQSGFSKYVHSNVSVKSANTEILSIEVGKKVKPKIAQKVVVFTRKHLEQNKSLKSRRTYATIIECMGNTNSHAYKPESPLPKWYLMAKKLRSKASVSFTFLDGGSGIPATVKKNNMERFKKTFRFGAKDHDLMFSVLNGDFRTRTKEGHRGKGLPKIYKSATEKQIDNLVIIANNGYVNCATNKSKELKNKFYGTLLSWEFV